MRRDLNDAFSRFRDDEDAWVAIVTGAGRAFCVGADLRDGAGSAGDFAGTFWEKPTINSFESGWEIFKPVIAAVNGYCLGYGLTLVTWCDFVIASERAEFGFPEVRIGVPTIVGAIRLPQRIDWQYAMELLLTGERIDAARAKEIGLVGLGRAARRPDGRGAAPRRPAAARARRSRPARDQGGRGARRSTSRSLEAIRFGETMRKVAGATEDAAEGMRAAAERGRRSGRDGERPPPRPRCARVPDPAALRDPRRRDRRVRRTRPLRRSVTARRAGLRPVDLRVGGAQPAPVAELDAPRRLADSEPPRSCSRSAPS